VKEIKSRLPVVLFLAAALATGFLFRSWFASSVLPPPSRMQAETTQSYRYAKLFSETGSIPSLDTLVMHPEGWPTSQNSIFEEYIAGGIHRVTGGDFDSFMRSFSLLFPLFSVIFLYLWMRTAGYDTWIAAFGASLYSFLLPAILRARGGSLYRETVALPMLTALGWLTESSLRDEGDRSGRVSAAAAGVVLFACLAAWKVTAFIAFFLFLYLLWRNWRRGDVGYHVRLSLGAAQIAASLLLPHMRHDGAFFSPATVSAVFVLLPSGRSIWFPVTATILSVLAAFAGGTSGSHVSEVILAKLRFLFSHPEDPGLLSDDARIFWVPGYTSPSPAQFLFLFGVPLLASLPGMADMWRNSRNRLLLWFLPLSMAGYLFFDRLMVLLALALIPPIAMSLRRKWFAVTSVFLILLQSVFPGDLASMVSSAGLDFEDSSSLLGDSELDVFLAWTRDRTDRDDAVLSFWHISGLVSAYADRPVVTHTFFENSENRRTIMRFARTLFLPEDSLVTFMREKECRLLVYQADFLLDRSHSGLIYLAGLRDVPRDAAALMLHYSPDSLDSLEPVFQGPSLRVFSLDCPEPTELQRSFLFQERYRHCCSGYDEARSQLAYPLDWSEHLANRAVEMRDLDMLSGALLLGLQGGLPEEDALTILNDLIQLYIHGSYGLDGLAEDVHSFIWYNGPDPGLSLLLARFYASEGLLPEAMEEYSEVLRLDPSNMEAAEEFHMIEVELRSLMDGAPE